MDLTRALERVVLDLPSLQILYNVFLIPRVQTLVGCYNCDLAFPVSKLTQL